MKRAIRKKTKIMAIGDIHGDTGLVKKLAEKAKKEHVDLVILAGDLTIAEQSTKNIIGPFAKIKKPVLLLHGNHESLATANFLADLYSPSTKNLHGYSFTKDDIGIFGAGGAIEFNISEKELLKTLERGHLAIKDKKKKIMVTHMHVQGTKSEFSGFPGSISIRKSIKKFKPDIVIHAHIHEAKGIEEKIGKTRIVNVSRKEKIFEI